MWSRLAILFVTLFWLVMMTLLWRSEFGHRRPFGARVPVASVWNRILTAPDASTLEIRRGTNVIGQCQLRCDLGQVTPAAPADDFEEPLEGMVEQLAYYRLDFDGTLNLPDLANRVRFGFMIRLNTNRVWQEFQLHVNPRPDVYEVSGDAVEQKIRIHVDAGSDRIDRSISFNELRNPQRLLSELGGPALPLVLGVLNPAISSGNTNLSQSLGVHWSAENATLMFGRNSLRVYRLRATMLNRYHATFYVSPVGEILRAELPDNIVLVNNAVSALRKP